MGNAQGIRAGKAYIELSADAAKLNKGLHAAEARIKQVGANIAGLGSRLAAGGAAIVAPLFEAATRFADVGSELNDMSARTGLSVEALSQLGFAAQMTGSDLATVEGAVKKLQKNLSAAAMGSDQAQVAFAELGLSAEQLLKLSPERQFSLVAGALGRIPNPSARAAAAMTLLGKSGTALLPMIGDLDALSAQAREMGLVMSTEDAEAADALGDALDVVKASVGRVVTAIGAALAPELTNAAETTANVVREVIAWADANRPLVAMLFNAGLALAVAGGALLTLGAATTAAGVALGGIGSILAAVFSPLGLIVAGVAGLAYWFDVAGKVGGASIEWLGDRLGELLDIARETFGGIADALSAGDIALAAQVLWAGMKVEWLKGVSWLKGIWADWGVAFVQVWADAKTAVASLLIELTGSLRTIWTNMTAMFRGTWGDLIKGMIETLMPFRTILEAMGVDVSGALDQGLKTLGFSTGQAETQRQSNLARIGEETDAQQRTLTEDATNATDARRAAALASVEAANKDLADAQAELASLTGQADNLRRVMEASTRGTSGDSSFEPDTFDPSSIEAGVAASKAKVDVAGSFSASAIRGLGVGESVGTEQLKEQKKAAKELEKLNRKAELGRLVFTS